MSINQFSYSKSWRNASDFPSYEEDETQVREDLQCLFDEIRDALNDLIAAIRAENVPFAPTAAIDASNLQNAVELVQSQIAGVAAGQIPNGSVGSEKLAALAVTTAKLAALAVTAEKLADGAVTAGKLAAGAVGSAKLADGAVGTGKLADGAVTAAKIADSVLAAKADLVGGKVRPSQLSRARLYVNSSRSLTLDDEGKLLQCGNSASITLTVPTNASAAFPVGTEIGIYRTGTGAVNLAAASGVTLYRPGGSACINSRYSGLRLRKLDTNAWLLEGEGLAPAGYLDNFSAGLNPQGMLVLKSGVHYFASEAALPAAGTAGRICLVPAE